MSRFLASLRLIAVFFRIGAMNELAYKSDFFVQLAQSLMALVMALGTIGVVLRHTSDLAGWRPAELIALVGVYYLVGGLIGLVIQPSMQRFMEDVRQGTLDFTLTKPADAQFLVSIREFEIWKILDMLMGVVVLGFALIRLQAQVGLAEAALFATALLAGAVIIYCFWLILATLSFWFVRVYNILVLFENMYQAARWPVSIYPGWLRATLTFLIPVAFAVTVPSEALAGRLSWQALSGAIALAIGIFIFSRWFWIVGLRRYSGASA